MVSVETTTPNNKPSLLYWGVAGAAVVALVLAVLLARSLSSPAQPDSADAAQVPARAASAAAVLPAQPGPQWHELNPAQKAALQPLGGVWNSLGQIQKKKWIALAKTFPSRSPENQARLQERMVQWAALTPREREMARLNFAETKKVSADELAASWAAYQELSPEERARLAAKGASKPTGSAVAIAPTPNDKITAVPITRHTSPSTEPSALVKPQLDPNTLLPKVVIAPTAVEPAPSPAEEASKPAVSSDTLSPN